MREKYVSNPHFDEKEWHKFFKTLFLDMMSVQETNYIQPQTFTTVEVREMITFIIDGY